jgi:SAM-dependent methyltransferase
MPRYADTQQIYDTIYKKGAVAPGYDRYWKYAQFVKSTERPLDYLAENEDTYWGVREALLRIDVANTHDLKILEIGSGLGYLTFALREAGYNAYGLDISEEVVKLAKSNYGDYYINANLFEYAVQNQSSYDVIIFTEVIEHVNSPISFVEAVFKLLKNGGKTIITTPNKSLYPQDIVWESDLPPIHCWWFSESSIKYIAKELHASLMFIDFSNYYQTFCYVDFNALRNKESPKSFLDQHGNFKKSDNNKTKSKLRTYLAKNPFLKRMYFLFRISTNGGIVRLKNRGLTLCAIVEKNI